MPTVKIPPAYQGPTKGQQRVEVEGTTVLACIESLCERHPEFRDLVFGAPGVVHRFVTLFINGEEIDRAALDTPVTSGDEVELLAAIAGG